MTKIEDVRACLMQTLEGLKNGTIEIERGKVIAEVGQVLVNSARAEVEFMKATGGTGTGFIENTGRRQALKAVSGD